MGRSNKKIEIIAVTALSTEVNKHDLLHPLFGTNDKTRFFDGFIEVDKDCKDSCSSWLGRITVQIKGTGVNNFSESEAKFSIKKEWLLAYQSEFGIIFFIVEILKNTGETKIFCKPLLPFDIIQLLERMGDDNSIKVKMPELKNDDDNNLSIICHSFLYNRKKQSHPNLLSLDQIKNIVKFHVSAPLHDHELLNRCIHNKQPFYFYAEDSNETLFPIGNLSENFGLLWKSHHEVFINEKSYGYYITQVFNDEGVHYQFGDSLKFFPFTNKPGCGRVTISFTNDLDQKIKDVDFLLELLSNGFISINGQQLSFQINISELECDYQQKLLDIQESLHKLKQILSFVGIDSPIDLTTIEDNDLKNIFTVADNVFNHNKQITHNWDNGKYVVKIGRFQVVIFHIQGTFYNFYSREFYSSVKVAKDYNQKSEVSPYIMLSFDDVQKSSNFKADIVMESINSIPFSEVVENEYNRLLLDTIRAWDSDPGNSQLQKFAEELSKYLLKNNESIVNKFNHFQVKKRLGTLNDSDIEWLTIERDNQDSPIILCAIALLLSDQQLFDDQFGKLTEDKKDEFNEYPIINLLTFFPGSKIGIVCSSMKLKRSAS